VVDALDWARPLKYGSGGVRGGTLTTTTAKALFSALPSTPPSAVQTVRPASSHGIEHDIVIHSIGTAIGTARAFASASPSSVTYCSVIGNCIASSAPPAYRLDIAHGIAGIALCVHRHRQHYRSHRPVMLVDPSGGPWMWSMISCSQIFKGG
jgi:hypothetical protein